MASTATVTGTMGAGISLTATVFTGITSFTFDTVRDTLTLIDNKGDVIGPISISNTPTVTVTVGVTGDYTLTVS